MEMYADEDARGGVLEPEGIVNIKYRRDKQLDTMTRLDPTYAELKAKLADKSLSKDQQSDIKVQMTERESLLLPVYTQIALQFADLHDRAGRMKAKGTIRQALRWREARRFFYWRLLNEESIIKKMASSPTSSGSARGPTSREHKIELLRAWSGVAAFDTDDKAAATWYEENRKVVNAKVEALKAEAVAFDVAALMRGNHKEGALKGVQQVLSMLPVEEREGALKFLAST